MNNIDFEKIVEESINKIRNLLLSKGEEYVNNNEDRLKNFKDIAFITKVIPEKALLNLVSKHIMALFSKVDNLNNFQKEFKSFLYFNADDKKDLDKYDEYIMDIIVYMILLRGLLVERQNWK